MFETETRLAVYNYKPSLNFLLKFVMVASVIFIAICLRFSSGVIKIDFFICFASMFFVIHFKVKYYRFLHAILQLKKLPVLYNLFFFLVMIQFKILTCLITRN